MCITFNTAVLGVELICNSSFFLCVGKVLLTYEKSCSTTALSFLHFLICSYLFPAALSSLNARLCCR